jgi:DNA-binding CsgD family transcriptional regulator
MIKKLRLAIENGSHPNGTETEVMNESVPTDKINEVLDILKIAISLTAMEANLKEVVITIKTDEPFDKNGDSKVISVISNLCNAMKINSIHYLAEYIINEKMPQKQLKLKRLSKREQEVAYCIKEGLSTSMLSKKLKISIGTAKIHRKHIYKKLDIHKTAELINWLNKYEQSTNQD